MPIKTRHLMLLAPLLLLSLAPAPPNTTLPDEALCPEKVQRGLLGSVADLAKLGRPELVDEMQAILTDLGTDADELSKWRKKWDRSLEKAKPTDEKAKPVKPRALAAAAKKLARAAAPLEKHLVSDECSAPETVAALVLRLDSASENAHTILGHEKVGGRFVTPEEAEIIAKTAEVTQKSNEARALEIEAKVKSPSTDPMVVALYGENSHTVSMNGFEVHGGIAPERLERCMREAMRAMAFSEWMRGGKLDVPKFKKMRLFYVNDEDDYLEALDIALEKRWINEEEHATSKNPGVANFQAKKGLQVLRWTPEASISADITWYGLSQIFPQSTQQWLFAGHVNWLCLRFFGTTKPAVMWQDPAAPDGVSTAKRNESDEALWRAAASGVFGARSYVKRKIERGDKVSIAGSIVDLEGKLGGEPLLLATLGADYLQSSGRFEDVAKTYGKKDEHSVALTERALEQTVPEFDKEWTGWLLGESGSPGIIQSLGAPDDSKTKEKVDPEVTAAKKHLTSIREQAFAPLNVWTETLEHYDELSVNAATHAAYLNAQTEQAQAWPDAHEEYPDQPDFTPEGAWAGGHSVIAFSGDSVRAIDDWLATFYHRLPLLEPGLCGFGVAVDGDVVVLDSGSLVNTYAGSAMVAWPPADADDVPRRFRPELPNPVPGEDQTTWGYPITIQSYSLEDKTTVTVEMALFEDSSDEQIDCHFITPTTARFKRLAPKDAYCLIPKEHLAGTTRYRVEAHCPETDTSWNWTFTTDS